VTTLSQITRSPALIKQEVMSVVADALDSLLSQGPVSGRTAETAVWDLLLDVGRVTLAAVLGWACWSSTSRESASSPTARLRLDRDYWLTQTTTLGKICVPLFAYRDESGRTQVPARAEVFPLHPHCRSSELCLEWEARLGSQLPFRQAEEALRDFTHGACVVEDTTISRHLSAVGSLLGSEWTYRSPEQVAKTLRERATRDSETGRPLLYLSTDAHALRRYVDETWTSKWKMINGIRLWCIDGRTGEVVHLGGEYTWGDCQEVATRVRRMVKRLIPTGDDAPQVVLLADGMPWIWERVLSELPADTIGILDFYHATEHLADYAKVRFGAGTKAAKAWYNKTRAALLGKRQYTKKPSTTRKGHKKRRRTGPKAKRTIHLSDNPHGAGEALVNELLADDTPVEAQDSVLALLHYISGHADRMDYPAFRARGIQIGSGAMESLHRTASQARLKLAGTRWLAENALAVLNARMVQLAQRWHHFWAQPQLTDQLKTVFAGSAS